MATDVWVDGSITCRADLLAQPCTDSGDPVENLIDRIAATVRSTCDVFVGGVEEDPVRSGKEVTQIDICGPILWLDFENLLADIAPHCVAELCYDCEGEKGKYQISSGEFIDAPAEITYPDAVDTLEWPNAEPDRAGRKISTDRPNRMS